MPHRALIAVLAAVLAGAVLAACGSGGGDRGESGTTTAVATTSQVADLARAVAGERAAVRQILQPNSDPHEYEPRPSDVRAVTAAGVVLRSGGDVDGWLDGILENAGSDATVVTMIDVMRPRRGGREVDPHWWQDPRNAVKAVAAVEDALAAADPDGAAAYARAAEAYTRRLTALDTAVADCLGQLPAEERKLVTTHDALGYYARRYGLEVIGAVIPSLSTQAQASAGEVAELVDTIEREGVRAIFAESSVNPKLERVVADESGAAIGRPLWADTLGPAGSDGATYLESIAANTRAIADGLSGGSVRCRLPD
jgi:ABC-type Zn uptake system ZnuABC Zn-binding protein ZnuA